MQIRHKQMAIKVIDFNTYNFKQKSQLTKATLPRLQSTKFIILSNNLLNNNNNSYKSNHSSRHNNNRIIYTRMFYSIKLIPSSNNRSKHLNNNTSRNSKCLTIKMATRYTYWEEKMKPIILIRSQMIQTSSIKISTITTLLSILNNNLVKTTINITRLSMRTMRVS